MRWTICRKNTGSMIDRDRHAIVLAENSRLIALLELHRIEWRLETEAAAPSESAMPVAQEKNYKPESSPLSLSTSDKVALFRRLFRGRTDVNAQKPFSRQNVT